MQGFILFVWFGGLGFLLVLGWLFCVFICEQNLDISTGVTATYPCFNFVRPFFILLASVKNYD